MNIAQQTALDRSHQTALSSSALADSPPVSTGPGKAPDPEVTDKARRRQFTASYKLRILQELDRCTESGQIGALLRREGLYSSHLTKWRRERQAGLLRALSPKQRGQHGPSPLVRENEQLRRENEELKRKLEQAETIIEFQKKVAELFGTPRPQEKGGKR
jgi:transposase